MSSGFFSGTIVGEAITAVLLFVGVFVLWALYGKDESDAFFAAGGRREPPTAPTTTWTSSDPTNH